MASRHVWYLMFVFYLKNQDICKAFFERALGMFMGIGVVGYPHNSKLSSSVSGVKVSDNDKKTQPHRRIATKPFQVFKKFNHALRKCKVYYRQVTAQGVAQPHFEDQKLEELWASPLGKYLLDLHGGVSLEPKMMKNEKAEYIPLRDEKGENIPYSPLSKAFGIGALEDCREGVSNALQDVLSNKEACSLAQECKLTGSELLALRLYTTQAFSDLASDCRSEGGGRESSKIILKELTSALAKLPDYEGPLTRGAKLPFSVGKEYQKGKIVSDRWVLSFSPEVKEGEKAPNKQFLQNANYVIQLTVKEGDGAKNISPFSTEEYSNETEIIFAPGTGLLIKKRVIDNLGGGNEGKKAHRKHPLLPNENQTGLPKEKCCEDTYKVNIEAVIVTGEDATGLETSSRDLKYVPSKKNEKKSSSLSESIAPNVLHAENPNVEDKKFVVKRGLRRNYGQQGAEPIRKIPKART